MTPTTVAALSHAYLLARLSVIDARVAATVAARRQASTNDRFLGMYLTDDDVDTLLTPGPRTQPGPLPEPTRSFLARIERAIDESPEVPRLRSLATAAGLDDLDVEILLVAIAPDVDVRFERLYGYLHDDLTQRRPSIGLALDIAGVDPSQASARERFSPSSRLRRDGILTVEDERRPFLGRPLRVPDSVTAHLLGGSALDPVVDAIRATVPGVAASAASPLAVAIEFGTPLAHLRASPGVSAASFAVGALETIGRASIVVDLERLDPKADLTPVALALAREARLCDAVVVAGPLDAITTPSIRLLAELPVTTVLHGSAHWDSAWGHVVPFLVEVPTLGATDRVDIWRSQVNGTAPPGFDAGAGTQQFRLTPDQIARAVTTAETRSQAERRALSMEDLHFGARAQNSAGLERLARRLVPRARWDQLVLPDVADGQLRELASRARRREVVLDDWGMGTGARRRGIIALFAGPPGTGKTMAAEVIAADLGLDLYVINLATVVDKYIGETEKNLERIFAEAEGVNCILFFDEADALFGKRSEVKDARDRYANVEISYLLQRMERFDGTAILATNLKANVDEAFARRLDVAIDFQVPEASHRLALWQQSLRAEVPVSDDLDYEFLAEAFELSGGNITNIAVTAAFLAAEAGTSVTMADLIRATEREYRKLGLMRVRSEFGRYFELLDASP